MCGIIAAWNLDGRPLNPEFMQVGLKVLSHRGPDDEGFAMINSRSGHFCEHNRKSDTSGLTTGEFYDVGLGHTRLAILDLSAAGHQPMRDKDAGLFITFNGEIYNFRDIKRDLQSRGYSFRTQTDTEVVLRAYQEWGADCLGRFNGMWAFAIWDARRHRLFVARDRFGVKPLVYFANNKTFICASEIKAIVANRTMPRDIDKEALHHYLSLGMVPAPHTIYEGISKLLPGHYMVVDSNSVSLTKYWNIEPQEVSEQTAGEASEALDALLHDSIRLQRNADVPVGAFLSGGLDSSVVSAIAAKQTARGTLNTFCCGFDGLETFDETDWASKVAAHIRSKHNNFALSLNFKDSFLRFSEFIDEPFASPSAIGIYLLAQEASKDIKVVLTGDGGDEVFCGYEPRYLGVDEYWDRHVRRPFGWLRNDIGVSGYSPIRWERESLPQRLLRRWRWEQLSDRVVRDRWYMRRITHLTDEENKAFYSTEWADAIKSVRTFDWLTEKLPKASSSRLARWQRFDLTTTLPDEMLAKIDKATMACGLEARVPLLDHRIVEYAINLPADLKIQKEKGKLLLKQVGEHYLPEEVVWRKKQGFTLPLGAWFRTNLRGFLHDTLDEAHLKRQNIFQPSMVRKLMEAHDKGHGDYSQVLYSLVCFQTWYQKHYA